MIAEQLSTLHPHMDVWFLNAKALHKITWPNQTNCDKKTGDKAYSFTCFHFQTNDLYCAVEE